MGDSAAREEADPADFDNLPVAPRSSLRDSGPKLR